MVIIVVQYVDGRPNGRRADGRPREASAVLGDTEGTVVHQRIETVDEAVAAWFTGSPTILIDGRDPFAADGAPPRSVRRAIPVSIGRAARGGRLRDVTDSARIEQ